MIVCQWHLDLRCGTQAEALAGASARQCRRHSDALTPLVVPGSRHRIGFRVVEAPAA
jgi:hypothetical protein